MLCEAPWAKDGGKAKSASPEKKIFFLFVVGKLLLTKIGKAWTSVKFSKKAPLSKLNNRVYEIVEVFIDNKIPPGDSIININQFSVGPASTITGSFILNSILIEVANMLKTEKVFPFYISSNMPNANKNNNKLENKFRKINPHL